MIVEEKVLIRAPLEKVWQIFMDLKCWPEWNTVLEDVSSANGAIEEGGSFRCCIRPYVFPVYFEPKVTEIRLHERILWIGEIFGLRSRHEFLFKGMDGTTEIISRENFSGLSLLLAGPLFPRDVVGRLNADFLCDLKRAAEAEA